MCESMLVTSGATANGVVLWREMENRRWFRAGTSMKINRLSLKKIDCCGKNVSKIERLEINENVSVGECVDKWAGG